MDAVLNQGDADVRPPKRHTERPPRPGFDHMEPTGRFHDTLDPAASDPQRSWDETRAAAVAAAAAKENDLARRARARRRGKPGDDLRLLATPTVERMSIDALAGSTKDPRRRSTARRAAHSLSRW